MKKDNKKKTMRKDKTRKHKQNKKSTKRMDDLRDF